MLPRIRGLLVLSTILCAGLGAASCGAQQGEVAPVVRYHFGDDPDGRLGWAKPDFDDSSWPVARDGDVPAPAYYSDGMVWVRVRVAAPKESSGPLAFASLDALHGPGVQQFFVNGVSVGQDGSFSPALAPRVDPRRLIYELPAGLVQPGSSAVAALRGWSLLPDRGTGRIDHFAFAIGSAQILRTAAQADWATALLVLVPQLLLDLLLILAGLALVWLAGRSHSRELMLNGLWLMLLPLFLALLALGPNGFLPMSIGWFVVLLTVIRVPGMYVNVEFIWTVHQLHSRLFRLLFHFFWIAFNLGAILEIVPHRASLLSATAGHVEAWGLVLHNVINLSANLWVLFVLRRNRVMAAAFAVIPLTAFLQSAGLSTVIKLGPVVFDWFSVGFLLAGLTITTTLVGRALAAWRTGSHLRAELEAARQVQQKLVPATVPAIEGYRIGTAYLPATEVGGDFYQVLEQRDGSALVLVGDVSGKGLKAAMNGVLAIGAARALASEQLSPGMLLTRLNAELAGSQDGGFITCLCAHIAADGTVVIANAGHLAPYRNGDEVEVDSGLPLGIATGMVYAENRLKLGGGETLLLLSDGVVEARNATGELFGFERTRAISKQHCGEIAHAAQRFGQEDDITVLTVTLASTGVLHA